VMKAKAIPLSTNSRTARRPSELLVGATGSRKRLGAWCNRRRLPTAPYYVHLRAHLEA
jgi:hypothetical protein